MIVKFKLPRCGWEIDVESEPAFGDYDAIDSYMIANTQGAINPETEKWEGKVPGSVLVNAKYNKVEILVKAVRNAEGSPLGEKVVDIMKSLHPEDGRALIKFVEDTFEDYKKKLDTTVQQ